jgi:hypothetical protein
VATGGLDVVGGDEVELASGLGTALVGSSTFEVVAPAGLPALGLCAPGDPQPATTSAAITSTTNNERADDKAHIVSAPVAV